MDPKVLGWDNVGLINLAEVCVKLRAVVDEVTKLRISRNADIAGLPELLSAVQRGLLGEFGYSSVQ
jgi:hypothetical protein